jgi:hypothetical protein
MIKTITERFDKDGKLVERITVEETKDESTLNPSSPYYPWWSHDWMRPVVTYQKFGTGGSISCDPDSGITVHSDTDNICSTRYTVENLTYTN